MLARVVVAILAASASACDAAPKTAASCAGLERPLVIMVHGSGLAPAMWRPLASALRQAGYEDEQLVAVALQPSDGDNVRAATETLRLAVDDGLGRASQLARARGCDAPRQADFVAHSMGSVSARWYAAYVRPDHVRMIVGIAPSNHGTDALCGHAGTGNQQMCPSFDQARGSVQAMLNGTLKEPRDETPYGLGQDSRTATRIAPTAERSIVYVTVRLSDDRWIQPTDSAVLDGAGGVLWRELPSHARMTTRGNVLWGRAVDHDSFPQDPELIGAVVSLLTTAP
jgi:pimeloyl-ACP methyl ester carboxylesterase